MNIPISIGCRAARATHHRRALGLWRTVLVGMLAAGVHGSVVAADPALTNFVARYCLDCHDNDTQKGDLNLELLARSAVTDHPETWERVVRQLNARHMPPPGKPRPDQQTIDSQISGLVAVLDRAAEARPRPGRTDTFRRLNRAEYQNAIRDLLDLTIDASALLPKDDASHGFDNVTVADLPPTSLDRYLIAAQKISRLAVGTPRAGPGGDTYRVRPDVTQEEQVAGLPPGTRGGLVLNYTFPRDGEYEIQIRLTRDRNEDVEGLREAHELEVLVDRARVKLFKVTPPRDGQTMENVDAHLKARVRVSAGRHQVGVTFLKQPTELIATRRQPYQAHFNMHRHPRLTPAIYQVSINGPYDSARAGDSPSRRRIFSCQPTGPGDEDACASRILSGLMRQAYRRPVNSNDLARTMEFFRATWATDGFEAGIEAALSSILTSPHFLFRIEPTPAGLPSKSTYAVPDLALATRLAFFLWSSLPDEELLAVASQGRLREPEELVRQADRLLADPRARSLVDNFAAQWLHLRNLDSLTPDLRLFPDFDDNLRQSFREETERFFESILREDRPVLDLLQADDTFLNERLARHYDIPHVYGSRFRRVKIPPGVVRGGLLRHGSILMITSYATRTSPVIRGNWILGNLLGTPPPPPPANTPPLAENTVQSGLPMRERLAAHRDQPACAGCHRLMDPIGFALENFDAVGRWRSVEDGRRVDAAGGLPDGRTFTGVAGLEAALRSRPELFVGTLTEKLLTFSLGRGIDSADAPAVRRIVRDARANDYRFSSLIHGIVTSVPFTRKETP